MFEKLKGAGRKAVGFVQEKAAQIAIVATAGYVGIMESAKAEVILPTMPVDFAEYATAGMVVVGTVLGAIAGIVIVVALTTMGLRKLSSAFSGRA